MSALYQSSARAIQAVLDKKGGVKAVLHQQNRGKANTAVYALVCQTLKYKPVIEEIINTTPSVQKEYIHAKNKQFKGLILLLVYELLFGNKRDKLLSSSSSKRNKSKDKKNKKKRFNELIINNKNALNSALVRIKISRQIANNEDLISTPNATHHHEHNDDNQPHTQYSYARVNTLKVSSEQIIEKLVHEYNLKYYETEQEYKRKCDLDHNDNNINDRKVRTKSFWTDEHIANLLVFTRDCKIAAFVVCIDGSLIIQNKSSCIPAFVLSPSPTSCVLDACAAPGNKTSHLVNIMHDQRSNETTVSKSERPMVVACDYDEKRCETLKARIKLFGMQPFVDVYNKDFLSISPQSAFAKQFDAILLDPTCSGSGLVYDRIGHYNADDKSDKVPKLSEVQKRMLLHAMEFENVQKIVYSTCSVHEQENEEVVDYALKHCRDRFEVIDVFGSWKQRGIDKYSFGTKVVRVNHEQDNHRNLHGFFVACFQRKHAVDIEHVNVKKRKISEIDSNTEAESMERPKKKFKRRVQRADRPKSRKWKVAVKGLRNVRKR